MLDRICLKAMAKEPEDRYATMADLSVALERKLDEDWGDKTRRWSLGSRFLAVAVIAATVLLLAYASIRVRTGADPPVTVALEKHGASPTTRRANEARERQTGSTRASPSLRKAVTTRR